MDEVKSHVYGFNPQKLLLDTEFPNDNQNGIKKLTKRAIRRLPILETESDSEFVSLESSYRPSIHHATITTTSIDNEKIKEIKIQTSNIDAKVHGKNHSSSVAEIQQKLQVQRHAAIIIIQSWLKGILIRQKFQNLVNFTLSQQSTSGGTDRKWSPKSTFPTFLVQEKLLKRYNRYLNLFKRDPSPPTFSYWCATYIQAHFKMRRLNRAYLEYKRTRYVDKDAGLLLVEIKRIGGHKELLDAIDKSYSKIYRFYRDVIKFRNAGDPKKLLKFINPMESKYIDNASGIHVRFRLGGEKFPPYIMYKIYTHHPLVDLGSFAPRNYTLETSKKAMPYVLFNKTAVLDTRHAGWYDRVENNGWRSISEKWTIGSTGFKLQEKQSVPFHHNKPLLRSFVEQKKKQRQIEWMNKMYQLAKSVDADEFKYADIDDDEDEELLDWSKTLDFSSYQDEWKCVATTGFSNISETFNFELVSN